MLIPLTDCQSCSSDSVGGQKPKLSKFPGILEINYVIGLCLMVIPEIIPSLEGVLSPIQHLHVIVVFRSAQLNPLPTLGMLVKEVEIMLGLSQHVSATKRFLNGSGARCLL